MNSSKAWALGITVLIVAATWIDPRWPVEQGQHSTLTVVGMIWLTVHARRWPTHNVDFALICAFLAIHSLAARWLYSNVPYDVWLSDWIGWSPKQAFGWQRNHTDRLIHFLYGLWFMPVLQWHAQQRWPLRPGHAFAVGFAVILISGLVYEWLEWGVALAMSPERAESYNGQQGDQWDAHKDMLLAACGALLPWPWLRKRRPGEIAVLTQNLESNPR